MALLALLADAITSKQIPLICCCSQGHPPQLELV
jgi:hypothetical protein